MTKPTAPDPPFHDPAPLEEADRVTIDQDAGELPGQLAAFDDADTQPGTAIDLDVDDVVIPPAGTVEP